MKRKIPISLPPRPEALITIAKALKSDDVNLDQVYKVLRSDVALFSSVISTVNSPAIGAATKIKSIEHAVNMLGLKKVYSVVQIAALKNSFPAHIRLERFWDTATEVAQIAVMLARRYKMITTDDAYTLGMLHDCGIPLMLTYKDDFLDVMRKLNGCDLQDIHKAQLRLYGVSHFQVGSALARHWFIPEDTHLAITGQANYLDVLKQKKDEHEDMRMQLCTLLLAKEISTAYRTYWRLNDTEGSLFELKPVLAFLGLCDMDFLDLKEEIIPVLDELAAAG